MARHRPRPALGRPAREGHPVRLREVRRARRRDDRERHHLPRPLGVPRGRQGPRLLPRTDRHALEAARSCSYGEPRRAATKSSEEMRAAGFDPDERRIRHFGGSGCAIQNLPRHLGQHSGGMVIAQGRLDEVVPLEPAAMPGRLVVQWDKDDCADLGIIKIDLLGLGMLNALEQVIPMVASTRASTSTSRTCPPTTRRSTRRSAPPTRWASSRSRAARRWRRCRGTRRRASTTS